MMFNRIKGAVFLQDRFYIHNEGWINTNERVENGVTATDRNYHQGQVTSTNLPSEHLTRVHHDVRDLERVKVYDARKSQRGALVPHGLHNTAYRL